MTIGITERAALAGAQARRYLPARASEMPERLQDQSARKTKQGDAIQAVDPDGVWPSQKPRRPRAKYRVKHQHEDIGKRGDSGQDRILDCDRLICLDKVR